MPLLTREVSLRRTARWQVVAWSAAAPEPVLLHGVPGGLHAVAVSAAHQARDVFPDRASYVSELPSTPFNSMASGAARPGADHALARLQHAQSGARISAGQPTGAMAAHAWDNVVTNPKQGMSALRLHAPQSTVSCTARGLTLAVWHASSTSWPSLQRPRLAERLPRPRTAPVRQRHPSPATCEASLMR